jgi:2'-5' RNA ligase
MFSKRLNIAIVPSQDTIEYSLKIINELTADRSYEFILDEVSAFSHITLYSCEFPEKNIYKIKDALDHFLLSANSFIIEFSEIRINSKGFIIVDLRITPEHKEMHQEILELLNPFREGVLREKYQSNSFRRTLTESQIRNTDKYGHPQVADLYSPHLTLGKFDNSVDTSIDLPRWEINTFEVERFTLFEMADLNGICNKPLFDWNIHND